MLQLHDKNTPAQGSPSDKPGAHVLPDVAHFNAVMPSYPALDTQACEPIGTLCSAVDFVPSAFVIMQILLNHVDSTLC
jgi:hypothetical protein